MTDNTQPLALMLADRLHHEQPTVLRIDAEHAGEELRRQHARIVELEAQLESIGAGGVSGPLMGQPQAMPDLSALTERGAKAWAGVDAQGLRDGFTAADMATAAAQGFRDGVASVAAHAGSEPVARVNDDGFIVEIGDLLIAPGQKLYLHPSPPEGMVGGWQDIATAPKDGARILLHPAVEVHDAWSKGHWSEQQGCWMVGGSASGVAHTYWLPLPPAPPTSSADSRKGE